jgi:hypothetical protein
VPLRLVRKHGKYEIHCAGRFHFWIDPVYVTAGRSPLRASFQREPCDCKYIDNETGAEVSPDWWPGDPILNSIK